MSPSSVEFHKIWIEQCAATEDIREQFGTKNALDYLVGEKLFAFVEAAEKDADFAAELPAFVAAIRRLFSTEEIRTYLDHLERMKFLAPPEPEIAMEDEEEEEDDEPWPAHPCSAPRNCCASPASGNCFSASGPAREEKHDQARQTPPLRRPHPPDRASRREGPSETE